MLYLLVFSIYYIQEIQWFDIEYRIYLTSETAFLTFHIEARVKSWLTTACNIWFDVTVAWFFSHCKNNNFDIFSVKKTTCEDNSFIQ